MCNILKETYSVQPKDIFLYKYKSNEIEMCPQAGIYSTTTKKLKIWTYSLKLLLGTPKS